MDNIFPEVKSCCLICPYRVGMLSIAVLAMITGSLTLSIIELKTNASFGGMRNVSEVRVIKKQELNQLARFIPTGLTGVSMLFMLLGLIFFYATLSGTHEEIVQAVVWGFFLTTIFSFILVLAVSMECFIKSTCLLSEMDWLTASCFIIFLIAYLLLWIHFISVANSYVLNGDEECWE